jgi:hypothetical protein
VDQLSSPNRAHLIPRDGHDRARLAVERHKLDFERLVVVIDVDHDAHVACRKMVVRQVDGQDDSIMLVGSMPFLTYIGCAVTSRGTDLPSSIIHTVRTLGLRPSDSEAPVDSVTNAVR